MFSPCDNEEVAAKIAAALNVSVEVARTIREHAIRALATTALKENIMEGVWAEEGLRALGTDPNKRDLLKAIANTFSRQ